MNTNPQTTTILRKCYKIKSYMVNFYYFRKTHFLLEEIFFWRSYGKSMYLFEESIFWKHTFVYRKTLLKKIYLKKIMKTFFFFKFQVSPLWKTDILFWKTFLENRFFLFWKQFWKTGFLFWKTAFESSYIFKKKTVLYWKRFYIILKKQFLKSRFLFENS